ncbi:MAG: RNA polymerase sigma factor [Melioribacteraceae bacterium]
MNLSDKELILKAQSGNMEAFEELIYRYDNQVLNIAKSFRNDSDDAKDIYQEVFIRVYNGLKNFQFKSEFPTWLYRITTNVCLTYADKKKRHQHQSIDEVVTYDGEEIEKLSDSIPGDLTTDALINKSDFFKQINKAIELLPAQQRLAFTLKYFQELKIREIADIMNCNEGTVKRYLFTSVSKLREKLKNLKHEV